MRGVALAGVVAFGLVVGSAAVAEEPAAGEGPVVEANGPADPAVEPEGLAGALTAFADTTATTVGGPIRLQLAADIPEGWHAEAVDPGTELGAFGVRHVRELERTDRRRVYALQLVALEAGVHEIPPVVVTMRGPDGAPVEVASGPIPIEVASNLPEPEPPPAEADAEAPPAEPELAPDKPALAASRDWRPVLVALAAALVAGVLAFLLIRRLRRRQPREKEAPEVRVPTRPAWEVAMEDLDRIAAARLVEQGELRRQYEEVTQALRRYLEDRYGVPALESTTDELRRHLRRGPVPPDPASRALVLLSEADLVKFAKAEPAVADARGTERRARDIVQETTPPGVTAGEEQAA